MKRPNVLISLIVVAIVAGFAGYQLLHKQTKPAQSTAASATQSDKPTAQSTTPQPPPTFNSQQYSLEDPTSIWVVVDKKRPLNPKSYAPADLTTIGAGQFLRAAAAKAYTDLVSGAKAASYTLIPESGYRSYNTQVAVYGNEVKNYGQAQADTQSARPGYSEHQTGWAIDIGSPGCIEDCFGGTAAAKWVLANAATYGFIQRYPPDKSSVTGYRHEPWHFRYVGTELAQQMAKTGQTTLEEFFGLPAAADY